MSLPRPTPAARARRSPRATRRRRRRTRFPKATARRRVAWPASRSRRSRSDLRLKPTTPAGASSGATFRHSSGRNPATRLTPPIVVRGSRSDETAATKSDPFVRPRRRIRGRRAMPFRARRFRSEECSSRQSSHVRAASLVLSCRCAPTSAEARRRTSCLDCRANARFRSAAEPGRRARARPGAPRRRVAPR